MKLIKCTTCGYVQKGMYGNHNCAAILARNAKKG